MEAHAGVLLVTLTQQGLMDSLKGLASLSESIARERARAEEDAARAETRLNDLRKIEGFIAIQREQYFAELKALQEAEAQA